MTTDRGKANTRTLATALLDALKDRGARQAFGLPGDFVLPFFRAVQESDILPLYTLSHEPSVGYAADAAGRLGSTLGVAIVTYGAGALNMVNAVAQAYAEKSPMVVISGGPGAEEARMGLGLHHQVKSLNSQFEIFREVTCAQAILNDEPARDGGAAEEPAMHRHGAGGRDGPREPGQAAAGGGAALEGTAGAARIL